MDASGSVSGPAWDGVLAAILEASHLVTGDGLSRMLDDAVRPVGLTAEVLLADLRQRQLTPVQPWPTEPVAIEGTVAGRAYQLGEIQPAAADDGGRVLWVPLVDGTERGGVVRFGLPADGVDDLALRRRLWTVAGLVGHVTFGKLAFSDRLKQLRAGAALTIAS